VKGGGGRERQLERERETEAERVREKVHLIQMKIQRGICAGGVYICACVFKRETECDTAHQNLSA